MSVTTEDIQESVKAIWNANTALVASFEIFSGLRYDATPGAEDKAGCDTLANIGRHIRQGHHIGLHRLTKSQRAGFIQRQAF